MARFSAIALDRVLEVEKSESMAPAKNGVGDSRVARWNSTPTTSRTSSSRVDRGVSVPPMIEKRPTLPRSKSERKNGVSTITVDSQFSPALYATPKPTPIPDNYSPSSYPPSPYVINHKRRGPNLLKSFSEVDVNIARAASASVEESGGNVNDTEEVHVNLDKEENMETTCAKEDIQKSNGKTVLFNLQQLDVVNNKSDTSVKINTEGVFERSMTMNQATPMAEFYDAWEELISDSTPQPQVPDIESELREIRLSILMEIEKRKQAEEALENIQTQWRKLCRELSIAGLTLPANPLVIVENEKMDLSQQVFLARFVSNSIGRGTAKAEVEMEMEAQLEAKNFEITRLLDKLHYYESVNREMSQRNQEAVDTARRLRQKRKKMQRRIWGSIAATITIGSAVLAWSYLSSGKGSSSSHAPKSDLARKE